MARRRRRSLPGTGVLVAFAAAGVLWLWSQTWGPALFITTGVLAAGAAIAWFATAAGRRRRRRRHLATLRGLLSLTPREFEHAVADLLCDLGFTDVEVTGTAGDLQADIVATDPGGAETIVQCKRYAPDRTIGSPIVQSFIGMARIHHECERAMFVTTALFTGPAQDLAEQHDIQLIDGPDLAELVRQVTMT